VEAGELSVSRTAYGWIRRRVPAQARQWLKGLPTISRLAESARPTGEQWLPVALGPKFYRRMLLPEAFHWISFEGYEPEGLAWVTRHVAPGAICVDVGGHLGVYSLLLAELVGSSGQVCTFEPFGPSADLMAQTLEANGVADRVMIVRAAVADSNQR
jgi:hypothetical protein